jgi:hypothetical protein
MELLDIGFVRPRQARYQAALRPDRLLRIDSTALSDFPSTAPAPTVHELCKIDVILSHCAQSSRLQVAENKERS